MAFFSILIKLSLFRIFIKPKKYRDKKTDFSVLKNLIRAAKSGSTNWKNLALKREIFPCSVALKLKTTRFHQKRNRLLKRQFSLFNKLSRKM